MPINDSAGVGVYLIDKSQRASTAIGFRSGGAIESDRGLCNTPMLISNDADYVNTFGTPSVDRHGPAAMEAYLLAQRGVPQVLVRAKNPELKATDSTFGLMKFSVTPVGSVDTLTLDTSLSATKIDSPVSSDTVLLYFKGEGNYCSKSSNNVAVRFSKPDTNSAYAKAGQSLRMQLFDFDGSQHIDEDTYAEFAFNPDVASVIDTTGKFKLDGYTIGTVLTGTKVTINTYVNGKLGTHEVDYSTIVGASSGIGIFDAISTAVKAAKYDDGTSIIKSTWGGTAFCFTYAPSAEGSYGTYNLYTGEVTESSDSDEIIQAPQELNCSDLSIAVNMSITLPLTGTDIKTGFYSYPCGSVTVTATKTSDSTSYSAKFVIHTSMYLKNRNTYMFMGPDNKNWADTYAAYCKEDYTFSMSYDDFDANNMTMQADAVLNGSKYIVSKSSDTVKNYVLSSDIFNKIHYFDDVTGSTGNLKSNVITESLKSYAYSEALQKLLSDNLTRWRCVVTPNLGDVMTSSDYLAAILSANESTLGLSNIGRAASVDVMFNLSGRHGNRFIADYSQYAYRTLAGKRTTVTMAVLVADLLNSHYNDGIPARPPMGYNYGQISCIGLSQQFSGAERNTLGRQYKINPVIEDGGYYIWEERTSQITDTSLSDIHCILSFIWMKYAIYDAMKSFVAEYNDQETVNRGLGVLQELNQTFITKKYIEEGIVSADKNVIGDEVLRFDYAVRFKGVARFVDVYITAYSQTQTLAVSLSEEA